MLNFHKDDARIYLVQLYEESRYFSNYLFYIFLTIYSGLIVLQVNNPLSRYFYNFGSVIIKFRNIDTKLDISKFILALFIFLSWVFVSYLLLLYHNMHGSCQEKIYIIKKNLLNYPDIFIENNNYKNFSDRSYLGKIYIGKGHKAFIFILLIIMLINIFYILNL